MSIIRIAIRIEGITALLMNRFSDEAAEAATSGRRGSSAAAERGTPLEQAQKKLYLGLDGKPMIPQPNLLRCIVDGGSFHKIGKKQVTTKESSLLYACVDIEGTAIPLEHKEPWRVDTRPVVVPSTKGRILCHRPLFDDWALNFELILDTSIAGPKLMRCIVDDSGKRVGLADFRPSRKGPFGKFVVTAWAEIAQTVPDEVMKIAAE